MQEFGESRTVRAASLYQGFGGAGLGLPAGIRCELEVDPVYFCAGSVADLFCQVAAHGQAESMPAFFLFVEAGLPRR